MFSKEYSAGINPEDSRTHELKKFLAGQAVEMPELPPGIGNIDQKALQEYFQKHRELLRLGRRSLWKYLYNFTLHIYQSAYRNWNEKSLMESTTEAIKERLDGLIYDLSHNQVANFDEYRLCEHGDEVLAYLSKYFYGLEGVAESNPRLERKIFNEGRGYEKGAVLFICGYGATFEPYTRIYDKMNRPIIAYQLPHSIVGDDPEKVGEVFNQISAAIKEDPALKHVTHVIGNSIGTMFASRLTIDIIEENPEINLDTALIQTGSGYPDALEHTNAKFNDQLRRKLKEKGLTFADFQKATEKYNPINLTEKLGTLAKKESLNLSIFMGLNDKMITPALELFEPLKQKMDKEMLGKYDLFSSNTAGHSAAILFFLWLCNQQQTKWSEIFDFDAIPGKEELAAMDFSRYHTRINTSRPSVNNPQ